MTDKEIVAGIDIGCSGVRCAIAIRNAESLLEIAGIGTSSCTGHIRQGVLVNGTIATKAIRKAVEEAEEICGLEIESAFVNITGLHVRGILGSATIQVGQGRPDEPEEITEEDIRQVVEKAGRIDLPSGCTVLEKITRDYGFGGFSNLAEPPVGLKAASVSARVYTIYSDKIAGENIRTVVENSGIAVESIVPSAVASASAVLNNDEKLVGTVVVDIGSANTDMVIYHGGAPVHLSSFAIGGDRITSDIQSLGIAWKDAEQLKKQKVAALNQLAAKNTLLVRKVGGRGTIPIALPVLTQIASHRVEEIFSFVAEEISVSGIAPADLTGGMVLTGGAARMPGIIEAAVKTTGQQVEPGVPREIKSDSGLAGIPEMATVIGLVKYGLEFRGRNTDRVRISVENTLKKLVDFLVKLR